MKFIEWNEDFSVGVREIDDQHKKLFEMLNTFYDSIKDNRKSAFEELLDELEKYSVYHLETEEKYMKQFKYEDTDQHIKEHKMFIEKVRVVQQKVKTGHLVVTFEITNFLRDWIADHELEIDKKFSDCLISNGLR